MWKRAAPMPTPPPQRQLPGVAQRDVIEQVDQVGGDAVIARQRLVGEIVRGVADFIFQAPAAGPGITEGDHADGAVLGAGGTGIGGEADGGDGRALLVVPAAADSQIPAFTRHRRCTESRGGNSRHGKHTELHFFYPRLKISARGNPLAGRPKPMWSLITSNPRKVSMAIAALREICWSIPRFYPAAVTPWQQQRQNRSRCTIKPEKVPCVPAFPPPLWPPASMLYIAKSTGYGNKRHG